MTAIRSHTPVSGYAAIDLLTSHHHANGMVYRHQLENTCCGAYVPNETTKMVETILAGVTILVTGGVGRVFLHGTNAIGECACTGVHGANRLASTSLLEALVWGRDAAVSIAERLDKDGEPSNRLRESIVDWTNSGSEHNDDPALIAQDWANIRTTMWNDVGISRAGARLSRAFEELRGLSRHTHDFYHSTPMSKPLVDLFHGCQTAYVIIQAALRNKHKMGCHNRISATSRSRG